MSKAGPPMTHDDPSDEIRVADESCDETRRRLFVDLDRRRDLLDAAAAHHRDAIGERQRLILVMRDDDEARLSLALDVLELELRLLAKLAIERAERFIEQQQERTRRQGARERNALTLAAR